MDMTSLLSDTLGIPSMVYHRKWGKSWRVATSAIHHHPIFSAAAAAEMIITYREWGTLTPGKL